MHQDNTPKWSYTSAPAAEPATYAQAKAQVRADDDTEQTLITSLIAAARTFVENYADRTFVTRNVQAQYYHQANRYNLRRGPVQSITSIVDGLGNTVSPSTYQLRKVGNTDYVYFLSGMPVAAPNPVTINYVAGYGDATAVPADVVTVILMLVAQWWLNREAGTDRQQYEIQAGMSAVLGQYQAQEFVG